MLSSSNFNKSVRRKISTSIKKTPLGPFSTIAKAFAGLEIQSEAKSSPSHAEKQAVPPYLLASTTLSSVLNQISQARGSSTNPNKV